MTVDDFRFALGVICLVLAIANLLTAFWQAWRGNLARFALPLFNFAFLGALLQFGAFG